MGGFIDWILWVVGGLAAIGGLAVAGWALFRDRPRGRRRCPRCWYDLTASPGLRCSECGHEASRERKLRKTRRHWLPARLGILATITGIVLVAVPRLRQGPEKIVPTTVLVMMSPDLDLTWPAGADELTERLEKGSLWSWQWRLLVDRVSQGKPFLNVRIDTNETWPESVALAGRVRCGLDAAMVSRFPWANHRVRIEARFDRGAEPIVIPLPRWPRPVDDGAARWVLSRTLGMPPGPGDGPLAFDVTVERSRARSAGLFLFLPAFKGEGWQAIHRTRIEVPVEVRGALEDLLAAGESQTTRLASRTVFVLNNRDLIARPPDLDHEPGMVLPVAIELRRHGEPVADWVDWWDPGLLETTHPIPLEVTGADRPFGTADYDESDWTVHVRGDPSRALLHPDATSYWSGEFEVELDLVEHPDLVFTNKASKPLDG